VSVKLGYPSKSGYLDAVGLPNMKMVAYRHRHLLIITGTGGDFLKMSTLMTLNDLEP